VSLLQFWRKTVLLILLAVGVQPAQAEIANTRWYDVEVILFAQTNEEYRNSESWPIDYTPPDMENARELLPQDKSKRDPARPTAFRLLDPDELKLDADARRIDAAPDLKLMEHFGWRQPGLPKAGALAVRVDQALYDRIKSMNEVAAGAQSATEAGVEQTDMVTEPQLEGTLRLILSRYLHIETDLLFKEPLDEQPASNDSQQANVVLFSEPAAAATSGGQTTNQPDLFAMAQENAAQAPYRVYFMHQSRRMRSNEVHYLDQPVFGMVIKVFPYQPQVSANESSSTQ
jgi:hypothetical protein